MVGLYNPVNGARLPIIAGTGVIADSQTRYQVGTLEVVAPAQPLRVVSCIPEVTSTTVGGTVRWNVSTIGGIAPYKYVWQDATGLINSPIDLSRVDRTYGAVGTKIMSVSITDSASTTTSWVSCTGTVNVSVLTDNSSPVGYLDGLINTDVLSGWVIDQDDQTRSVDIHVYADGPAGSGGIFIGSISANMPRPDLVNAGFTNANHGYHFQIPTAYQNGIPHNYYIYGINLTPNSNNSILNGSPKSYTIGTLDPVKFSSCMPSVSTTTIGIPVEWSAVASRGVAPYKYYWADGFGADTHYNSTTTRTYIREGMHVMSLEVIDSIGSSTGRAFCYRTVFVYPDPNLRNVNKPIGYLDGLVSTSTLSGWAVDKDNMSRPIDVQVYVDGPAESTGIHLGYTKANLRRPDLNTPEVGIVGDHGYNFQIPLAYQDGLPHTYYVYGVDLTLFSDKPLLTGAPKTYTVGVRVGNVNIPPGTGSIPEEKPFSEVSKSVDTIETLPSQSNETLVPIEDNPTLIEPTPDIIEPSKSIIVESSEDAEMIISEEEIENDSTIQ
jgi:hypothetical protein